MATETKNDIQISEFAQEVQGLDPLGADEFMVNVLPALNDRSDVRGITNAAREMVPTEEKIREMGDAEAHATIRDLGIIASSIQRHGVGVDEVPTLERSLILLGSKVDEVPRETVFHYGPWNPKGQRIRTFTGTEEEKLFIQSFKEGMSSLDQSINSLLQTQNKEVYDLNFAHLLDLAGEGFHKMATAMIEVRRKISPNFFSSELRPYFPVLVIGGLEYQAPGGAQMPILLLDRMIWGIDSLDQIYQSYYRNGLRYLPGIYRAVDASLKDESLVTRISKEVGSEDTFGTREKAISLLTSLLAFRYPHLKTAKQNFAIRAIGSKGSGGYTPEILEHLIRLTNEARGRLQSPQA